MKTIYAIAVMMLIHLSLFGQDKLSSLRTSKQIVTVENESSSYSIQILALKLPPSDASFFQNLDVVYEYPCSDGYVRYCVGSYNTYEEANSHLAEVRANGYKESFVTNTKRFSLEESTKSVNNKTKVIYPNEDYVVQLAAFRYPVYLTFFEGVDEVYEYRLNDKIFRYTTPPVKGSEVESLLAQMKGKGYAKAFIVEYERYSPYKIE
ncbi:MAG: hypothetical protein MJZ13_03365 [Bacteroidales bacterium]|nr:hypothetical protein [Bacteroidales bacterium]